MAFIKEARLHIRSVIENLDERGVPEGEPERFDQTTTGFLCQLPNGFSLRYHETGENGVVACTVDVTPPEVTVRRRGAVNADLCLCPNTESVGLYEVPPYRFDMKTSLVKLRESLSLAGGELDVFYRMNLGGADKKVRLRITVTV